MVGTDLSASGAHPGKDEGGNAPVSTKKGRTRGMGSSHLKRLIQDKRNKRYLTIWGKNPKENTTFQQTGG